MILTRQIIIPLLPAAVAMSVIVTETAGTIRAWMVIDDSF